MRSLAPALLVLAACQGPTPTTPPETIDPVEVRVELANVSAPGALVPDSTGIPQDHLLAPGVLVVHDVGWTLFEEGAAVSYTGLETLAEDGDNLALLDALAADAAVAEALSFAAKDDDYNDAPMLPGDDVGRTVVVGPDQRVTVIAMYGESNDVFVATPPDGLSVIDADGQAALGDVSDQLAWYDAGTEINQELGTGADQPMRQSEPGAGADEGGVVERVEGTDAAGFSWPAVTDVVALEIVEPPA